MAKSENPAYQNDLNVLREKIAKKKTDAFDLMKGFVQFDYDPRTSGYTSIEDALVKIVKATDRDIEKEIRVFEKKYPD